MISLLWAILSFIALLSTVGSKEVRLSVYPTGCNKVAAEQCEYQFLLCKLFNGPANDASTLCSCATQFYGSCLRLAGVSLVCVLLIPV